jgi:2'-5' RNA ligase
MAKIRTFICFNLPHSVKENLAQLQAELKKLGRGVRWSRPEGMHLTLKFLGDVDESKIPAISDAVEIASKESPACQIQIAGTGAFPNLNRPRVYWVGVHETSGALEDLQARIENELARLGFPKEKRKFSPHLTLGRVKFQDGIGATSAALEMKVLPSMTFLATEIIVMKSQLSPHGSRYTPLAILPLKRDTIENFNQGL